MEWTELSDLETKRRLIRTCGFLLKPRVDDYHTVALSYDTDTKNVFSVIHIPHVNVVKIKHI